VWRWFELVQSGSSGAGIRYLLRNYMVSRVLSWECLGTFERRRLFCTVIWLSIFHCGQVHF